MTWKYWTAAILLALALAFLAWRGERCGSDASVFALGHMLLAGCRE